MSNKNTKRENSVDGWFYLSCFAVMALTVLAIIVIMIAGRAWDREYDSIKSAVLAASTCLSIGANAMVNGQDVKRYGSATTTTGGFAFIVSQMALLALIFSAPDLVAEAISSIFAALRTSLS
jgi:hypothetical protein